MHELHTTRLTLRPYTAELIGAAVTNKPLLAETLGARIPAEWPAPDYGWFLPLIAQRLARNPTQGPWDRFIIHRDDRTLIGHVGFKGGPDAEGAIDIGYHIIPAYRGEGVASEAALAMSWWAQQQQGVRQLTATCDRQNDASARVLEKIGLKRVGTRGNNLLWSMQVGSARST